MFQALRLVEVRVRELGNFGQCILGTSLMVKAFEPPGEPLVDPESDGGEQQALRNLFMGAIGTFKNPGSHRLVTWESAKAAEAVYLANTLLKDAGEDRGSPGGEARRGDNDTAACDTERLAHESAHFSRVT